MTQSQPAGQPLDLDPIDRRARIASTIGELVTVSRRDVPALLAEVNRLSEAEETSRIRLWLIEQHISRNPIVIPLDLVPYLDGPLHQSDIDAYRTATATP